MLEYNMIPELNFLFQSSFWAAFSDWWWLFLVVECFWLGKAMLYLWYFWRKNVYDNSCTMVLLEVKIPEEVLETMKAMETIITGFWQICSPPNWHEKWWEGQSGFSFCLEIAAVDGVPHFYVRAEKRFRSMLESQIYSQYPQAEISEAEDYTQNVPQDVPNETWELWGTTYKNTKHWAYPIRTYEEFETGKEEEEKRIDPISSLLEGMARLKPGEQLWVQLRCFPLLDEKTKEKGKGGEGWQKEAEKFRDKLARRESKEHKFSPMLQSAAEVLVLGKVPEAPTKEVESVIPVEMKLTPVEKEVLSAVERKLGKLWFLCNLKYVYLAKREVLFMPNVRSAMSYFTNFVTDNMNALVPDGRNLTKVKKEWYNWFWFIKQRLYLKKRKLFRAYVNRAWVTLPRDGFVGLGDSDERFVLDAEEIATLYHFPGRMQAPAATLQRVETKKGEAPPNLPIG